MSFVPRHASLAGEKDEAAHVRKGELAGLGRATIGSAVHLTAEGD